MSLAIIGFASLVAGLWIGWGLSWWMRKQAREICEMTEANLALCEFLLDEAQRGPLHTADEAFE